MSFGGGGSGSGAITAHVHNNLAGEGGNLDDTTLLNTPTLEDRILIQAVSLG
jgi:hypothetical protein